MTENKPIMIDGVDVSGCEFYQIEANELYPKANYCGSMRNTFCEIEPNCNYKQLARKTQECETLLSQLDFEVQKKECLEQEYEELKKQIKKQSELTLKQQDISRSYWETIEKIDIIVNTTIKNMLDKNKPGTTDFLLLGLMRIQSIIDEVE